ncbi:hypothetical protein [Mycobacterium sp. C31M]
MTTHTEIAIAGVPWPMYKVLALVLGALALVVVGVAASSMGPAVLTAAGTATVVWLVGGITARR